MDQYINIMKLLWTFLAGAFIMGGWSTALEIRTQSHGTQIEKHEQKLDVLEKQILADLKEIKTKL